VIPKLGPNAVFIFTGVPGRKGPIECDTDFIMRDVVLINQVILAASTPTRGPSAAIATGRIHAALGPTPSRLITAPFLRSSLAAARENPAASRSHRRGT